MNVDYKTSVYLPKTNFSMKAGLPNNEPKILKNWQDQNLESQIREASKNRKQPTASTSAEYSGTSKEIPT